jgi:ribosomal protein L29
MKKKLTDEEINKLSPEDLRKYLNYMTKKSIGPPTRFHKIRTNIITKLIFLYQNT